jgi:hypothetical protein
LKLNRTRWGWKVFEAPGVEPVFPQKRQAIDYAETRACFRFGEIRVLDSTGNLERTIAFNERKLAEREVNSNRSVSLGRQGRLDYVNFGTLCSPHLSRCPKFFFPDRLDTLQLPADDLFLRSSHSPSGLRYTGTNVRNAPHARCQC